jgi:STE24 endopeptidase
VLMPADKYLTAGNYAVDKEKLSLITTFVDYLVFIWWVFAGFAWLSPLVHVEGSIMQAVVFLFGFILVNYIIGVPFELYQKFKIDEAYGFNKMTANLYLHFYLGSYRVMHHGGSGDLQPCSR